MFGGPIVHWHAGIFGDTVTADIQHHHVEMSKPTSANFVDTLTKLILL